jgi:monofunctional glycosyltransferase
MHGSDDITELIAAASAARTDAAVAKPVLVSALQLPRPYEVASVRRTLAPSDTAPSQSDLVPVVAVPVEAALGVAAVGHWSRTPPRPLVPMAYRAPVAPRSNTAVLAAPTVTPEPVAVPELLPIPIAMVEATPTIERAAVARALPNVAVAVAPSLHVESARRPQLRPELRRTPDKAGVATAVARLFRYAALAIAGYFALIATLVVVYRFVNPPMSSLMLQQRLMGQDIAQTWVAMDAISPQIVRAVLLSEDGRFCQHSGVDFAAMQDAIERAGDGAPRGASTISMQVTKNLYLWSSKSYVRKAIEIPLTWFMELIWPKRRIMEVYLNIAEWGPGIFGVEAASQFHFDKSASRLNEREAAQLAVALPNPHARDPGDPGPQTRRLASDIQGRMRGAYPSQTVCVLGARRGN